MSHTRRKLEEENYLSAFGLHCNPFPMAPDSENIYISERIDRIIAEITHGILTRKGFMVLAGDIGLGKTTISRSILSALAEKQVSTALVFHTFRQDLELLREINRDFGLPDPGPASFGDQMNRLNQFLLQVNENGGNCALIIDDAQNLSPKSLELIRMISNLEADRKKLIQILLIGQPELLQTLADKSLRQLKSRLFIKQTVAPLTRPELAAYLQFKLNSAGNQGQMIFSPTSIKTIHRLTGGNFRRINILADRCLYAGFAAESDKISKRIVRAAYADFPDKEPVGQPQKSRRRPLWALAALILLLVLAGGTYWAPSFQPSASLPWQPLGTPPLQAQPPAGPPVLQETVRQQTAAAIALKNMPAPSASTASSPPPPPEPAPAAAPAAPDKPSVANAQSLRQDLIADFLAYYDLTRYTAEFKKALSSGDIRAISRTLSSETGYELIQLSRMYPQIGKQYGLLAYPATDQKNHYYLLWQPPVRIKHFYYGYQGPAILDLQKKLAELGFYHASLDGIVGKYLMKAVLRLQTAVDLPVTGLPDQTTLFMLYHYETFLTKDKA